MRCDGRGARNISSASCIPPAASREVSRPVTKTKRCVLQYRTLGRAGDETVIEDPTGERLVLADDQHDGEPATLPLLPMLPKLVLHDQVMLVRFHHDLDSQKLRAKPLSIVTAGDIIRLTY